MKTLKQEGNNMVHLYILCDTSLTYLFCFRLASLYNKNEHEYFLEFMIYSFESLIIYEFCSSDNFGFQNKVNSVYRLCEKLLIPKYMLFNLFNRVVLIFTKLWWYRKKCFVDSISKLHKKREA